MYLIYRFILNESVDLKFLRNPDLFLATLYFFPVFLPLPLFFCKVKMHEERVEYGDEYYFNRKPGSMQGKLTLHFLCRLLSGCYVLQSK